jgi:hypothetical protein
MYGPHITKLCIKTKEYYLVDEQLILKIKYALINSWSKDTCMIFDEDYPYYGQCAQTTIIIFERFGGEILKTKGWPKNEGNGRHFYNRINGVRYDFTAEQFTDIPDYTYNLEYQDIISSVDEAATEADSKQIMALRYAFNQAFMKT